MKTWQAVLLHLALVVGAAILPTIKNQTVQVALGALVATGTAEAARRNSGSDQNGDPYPGGGK